ncbi:hypothetical protein G3N96_08645 [Burkholderia sp. Se-20373]|uniref:hypothetical protein n=1 Tax=Burkholderia sp. Se-20373 TaxID=2703898 RepID=UPI00197F981A|nr:hypothetical protein [Burkholderia sp. Se-20373]MBN3745502.1 hypothetical protein [Burkholderia sp. Se-20373]
MTVLIPRPTKRGRGAAIVATLLLAMSLGVTPACSEGSKKMHTTVQLSLWQVIDQIGAHQPIRREPVEHLLHAKLARSESSNEYFTFWSNDDGAPIKLDDGTQIERVVLRTSNEGGAQGALTLTLSGHCVGRDEVKAHFAGMRIAGTPTGRSPNEETTFRSETPWGELVFGFAERNPDCLSSVGFGEKSK